MILHRTFVCYLHWLGWTSINLGISFDLRKPNMEIHLPFCFIRVGIDGVDMAPPTFQANTWGWNKNAVWAKAMMEQQQ